MSSKFDFTARVRSEGKITIPSELREHLNLQPGELLKLTVHRTVLDDLFDLFENKEKLGKFLSRLSLEQLKELELILSEELENLGEKQIGTRAV